VTITVGDKTVHTRTDRSGYIDTKVKGHRLDPGWHEARISSVDAEDVVAAVLIVGAHETFGLISDIDDTVISTSLPRPMIAAWNTFVKSENARHVVPGMATMYRELLEKHPNAPMVYVSTGAWNTAPTLTRFLRRHGYPPVEVSRPPRKGERRLSGKSDAIDAEHAARTALANTAVITPKLADGQVEAIRLVKIARDTAVKAHTSAIITLKAALRDEAWFAASDSLGGDSVPLHAEPAE
jgi:hypothetical protein